MCRDVSICKCDTIKTKFWIKDINYTHSWVLIVPRTSEYESWYIINKKMSIAFLISQIGRKKQKCNKCRRGKNCNKVPQGQKCKKVQEWIRNSLSYSINIGNKPIVKGNPNCSARKKREFSFTLITEIELRSSIIADCTGISAGPIQIIRQYEQVEQVEQEFEIIEQRQKRIDYYLHPYTAYLDEIRK